MTGFLRRLKREVLPRLVPDRLMVLRGAPGPHKVALTFDDGPDWLTERYLDLLDELSVRATFFLIGRQVRVQPQLVLQYLRRGHEVLGHGYTHKGFPAMTLPELRSELTGTAALLPPPQSGAHLVRPPKGATDLRTLMRLQRLGYTPVMWSVDSLDYRHREPAPIVAHLKDSALKGGDIVLLHEGQDWTLQALPEIVGVLRERGLAPVTVSELLGQA